MLIDWFTVIAQTLNFLILVWLLRRFLYKPILDAVDSREKRIAAQIADAGVKMAEAHKERDEYQHKNEEFDAQRATLLNQATNDANAERQRLIEEAGKTADAQSTLRREMLLNEAHSLNQAIRLSTQQEVFAIARKTLADLAATSLELCMTDVFARRLRAITGPVKESLGAALKTSSSPVLIRSAFDLPAEGRATIQNALNETFSSDIPVRFETTPDLIGGVELTANGQKLAWSIADYLISLESRVGELIARKGSGTITTAQANAGALPMNESASRQ
ncbi:ATP synthase subunit B [Capsulimonas corticalis]|uniref:ATP synthase subunit b n=1 Tax=Capsulimonas corticalis TaxID=2219043 RepID=A0A402CXZ6_9BACT|nr:F0F1 ATP synthase subunit delta [Capsulimonas corticalis]BDI32106.1 ATP synthase subunit B [Capsulimonas corticalis]